MRSFVGWCCTTATNRQAILAELARLLKHKGILVLADLLSVEDPVKRATQNAIEERRDSSHVTVFSLEQARRLVAAAGCNSMQNRR
jgi:ubiquinone/menaquinone biosynthesis C-methylase UbiE